VVLGSVEGLSTGCFSVLDHGRDAGTGHVDVLKRKEERISHELEFVALSI
jgi:hypothetical protein